MNTPIHDVMKGQAGNRIIISCRKKGSCGVLTSHYENLDEFFKFQNRLFIEWYQIQGSEKVYC